MPALPSILNQYQLAILFALTRLQNRGQRHVYAGTVTPAEVARRRKANRVARKQRRANSRKDNR